jgi:hypothetical protein
MSFMYYSTHPQGWEEPRSAGADGFPPADLQKSWEGFLSTFSDWSQFWTLTFDELDRSHDVTRTEAEFLWRRLVQTINTDLYGHHYTRIVGHCYLDYALAFERGSRGQLHMHALLNGVAHWELVNRVWRHMAGIIKIKPVDSVEGAVKYVCKYVTKGGDVMLYRSRKPKEPKFKPMWYLEAIEKLQAHSAEQRTCSHGAPINTCPEHLLQHL